jgi:hypothetical protein
MARELSVQYRGALYHVMCRGDRREPIYADDQDRPAARMTAQTENARSAESRVVMLHCRGIRSKLDGRIGESLAERRFPNRLRARGWLGGHLQQ